MNMTHLNEFLIELKFNNSKTWFDEHRGRYQTLRAEFIALMGEIIAGVAAFDASVAAVRPQDTLFRINRDTRFAGDKSPYKTTFSAAISAQGRQSTWPLYYLQLGPDTPFVAGGLYMPDAQALRYIRGHIQKFPAKADALLASPELLRVFGGLSPDGILKRFPRGFGEASEVLKYRSFTVQSALEDVTQESLAAHAVWQFERMQPLHAWLRDALAYRVE